MFLSNFINSRNIQAVIYYRYIFLSMHYILFHSTYISFEFEIYFYVKLWTSFMQYCRRQNTIIVPLNFAHSLHDGYEVFVIQFLPSFFYSILKYFITWEFEKITVYLGKNKYIQCNCTVCLNKLHIHTFLWWWN